MNQIAIYHGPVYYRFEVYHKGGIGTHSNKGVALVIEKLKVL